MVCVRGVEELKSPLSPAFPMQCRGNVGASVRRKHLLHSCTSMVHEPLVFVGVWQVCKSKADKRELRARQRYDLGA